ncbi:hypothetical protein EV127DRAFT_343987 [Xylaria flabelliformis]|nr:hypothetical protein EV127DRAFT_343987 [Xylaria flabelliformis]
MSVSKQRISTPLEAGRSILDAHNLPPHLTGALEYTSKRLARKNLHITLIVVKNEYQLPSTQSCATPLSPPQTPESSASGFASPSRFTSPVAGLRQLVRRGTNGSLASTSSASSSGSETASSRLMSPTFPTEPIASPRRWMLPLTPGSPVPSTPMTPHTPSSFATITTAPSSYATSHPLQSPEPFGIRLIYTSPISPKDEKTMRSTITKAERKFHIGTGGLPAVMTASACGLSADLMRRSIQQNEVLFSSEGLTLLGLDRLYSFKAALSAYANSRLEDAVDCLRRLVLSNGGRSVVKADLYRSFDWMGVNPTALLDVERMYRRAYGGPERRGPFEAPPILKDRERENDGEADTKRMGFIKIGTPPPPKTQTTPVLKLNTNITTTPRLIRPKPKAKGHDCDKEEDGDRTPHPLRDGPLRPSMFRSKGHTLSGSIDELLSPCDNRQSQRLGPMTPNGYDDISPITRGEWGFLFKGDTWTQGTRAAVAFVQ